ncbi:MAG: 3-oxoacyl-[acyl-carrier-protein] reductase [Clostridiales bacterium]|nr:3-oxoacyl-[acyl-carrier-protein] reductase [Clostridiales bacterium]
MLTGKVAIVSGGSRGIGRAIVLELARNGADIVFNYLSNRDKAESLCVEARSLGKKCMAYEVDITEYEKVKTMVDETYAEYGRVDIVVNNAGITRDGALATMPLENWSQVINTNLTGAFNLSRAVIIPMMKQRAGTIINISSISGVYGNARQTNYSAAKAGLIGFTKSLAKEVASYGIRVNAIAPGFIETDMTGDLQEAMIKAIPAKRTGKAEEVAALVSFLCSDSGKYMIGDVIEISGGLVI